MRTLLIHLNIITYSYFAFKFQDSTGLLIYTRFSSNGSQGAIGNHFEKLATSYWHFLTYEK